MAHVAFAQGNDQTARELYARSLAIRRFHAGPRDIALSLIGLGEVARRQQDFPATQDYLEQALGLLNAVGDQALRATALGALADLKLDLGEAVPARQFLVEKSTIFRDLEERQGIARSLERAARLAVIQRQPGRAIRFAEAAESLRAAIGTPLTPLGQERLRGVLDVAREALGKENGASYPPLSPDEAVELALQINPMSPLHVPVTVPANSPLTPRQREVARLVARGLTNQQIAEALVISARTAETHVQQILSKLELTSRAQLAVWAVQHGLGTE